MSFRPAYAAVAVALTAVLVTPTAATAGKPPKTSAGVKTASGELQSYVDDFVAEIPGRDSGGYDVPTTTEVQTFTKAVDQVLANDLSGAAVNLDPLKYDVVKYTDTATNRVVVLLRERKVDGRYPHAWGLYGFGRASSPLVVEVPHPVADAETENVGVQAFRHADARALFVAGAHRYANGTGDSAEADMAHRTESVFDAVHRRLLTAGVRVMQPHGFGETTHDAVGHDVVVSNGAVPTATTTAVATALTAAGYSTCLYDGDSLCWQLGATNNVQGTSTREAAGEFAHVESYTPIRTDTARRDLLARTVAGVLQ